MSKIALVDLNSGLCRIHMGRSKDAPIGYAVEPTMQWLAEIRRNVDHVIVCLDGPPYFRKEIYPEYKAKRAEPDPELNQVKRDVKARLELDGYNWCQVRGFEADDLLATLSGCTELQHFDEVRLYTADKDGGQLCTLDGRVSVWSYDGKANQTVERDAAAFEKEFGVPPEDMALLQALMGDTSDGYPGIKSWGPKKAANAIKAYGTVDSMLAAALKMQRGCEAELKELPAVWKAFLEHYEEVPLYLQLSTLRKDVPIEVAPLLVKRAAQPLPVKTAHTPEPSDADDSDFYPVDEQDCDDEFAEAARVANLVDWNGTAVVPQDAERIAANAATIEAAPQLEGGHAKLAALPSTVAEYKALPQKLSCNYHDDCGAADAKMAAANAAGGPLPATAHHVSKEEFEALKAKAKLELEGKTAEKKRLANEAMDRALKVGAVAPEARSGESNDSKKTEEPCKVVSPEESANGTGARGAATGPSIASVPITATAAGTPKEKDAGQTPAASSSAAITERGDGAAASGSKTEPAQPGASTVASVVPATQGPAKPKPERDAIVRVEPPSWKLAVQPSDVKQVVWIADKLYSERALLAYADAGGAGGVALTIMRGRELGLGLAASLEAFHIVKGRPFPKAHFLQALAEKDPNCEWIGISESDDEHAICQTMHKKRGLLSYSYTIARAKKAGLLSGPNAHNWEKQPQNMCEARSKSGGVRSWYPGSTFGMLSAEEAEDGLEGDE